MLEQLLEAAAPAPGERVLDIGFGTGVTTVPFAQAVGPTGHVTGVDISRPMLEAAQRRIAEEGLGNVELLLADAQVHRVRAGKLRPGDLAARRHVLRRSDRRLPQPARRTEARRAAGHGGVGADRREHPLEDPVRDRGAASRGAGAAAAARAGTARLRRSRVPARHPEAAGYAAIAIEPRHFHVRGDSTAAMAEHVALFGWCSG